MKNSITENNMKNTTKTLSKYLKYSSQKQAILDVLAEGTEFSAAEARTAGIANPSAVIAQLRNDGFAIYSNPRKTNSGMVNKYRLNA